ADDYFWETLSLLTYFGLHGQTNRWGIKAAVVVLVLGLGLYSPFHSFDGISFVTSEIWGYI
ncbi:hypothetical protein ASPWEDRAFT_45155, partial [Aspergillus wentii DTO 134E9]